ncbi:MAG: 16S rRNA processing protein RimM [Clostridia bacterium]|nr:16S rRNA processing protein RimM [Clostridia bacterium]
MTKYLEIGQIVNTFGIKGMVKVKPFTDDIQKRFDNLEKVYIENKKSKKEYEIDEVKYHKGMVLIKFKGIDNPEEANQLRESYLMVDRQTQEPLPEGTYYIVDMIGLEVYTEEAERLGTLEDIFNTGSNDIYVVKNELGKQILLPAIKEVIQKIDMENKRITVHLIPGLI